MLTHTFHPGGVLEVTDVLGANVSHLVNGPKALVLARADAIAAAFPDARMLAAYHQRDMLEVVLHRSSAPAQGLHTDP